MTDNTELLDFEPIREDVNFKSARGDGKFRVRGLTTEDLSYLLSNHKDDFEAGYTLARRAWTHYSQSSLDACVLIICKLAPMLVAEIISVAADQPKNVANFVKLPLSVQALALTKIFPLTLDDAGGLKNLIALLRQPELRDGSLLKDVMGAEVLAQKEGTPTN